MLFAEVIQSQSWELVEAMLIYNYTQSKKSIFSFAKVFKELQYTEFNRCNLNINFKWIGNEDDINVRVKAICEKEVYDLFFIPWAMVLGMEIDSSTLKKYTFAEIIAHVLWNITFFGFDEETIQAKANKILKTKCI